MKICPVCHAVAFDDAEVCYGCLFHFEEGVIESEPALLEPGETENTLPVFSIRFTPEIEKAGSVKWNCAVEVA